MAAAVRFAQVSFSYPGTARPALDRVDLEIPEGSFALVVGPTGAGKSTLLRAVNGLVPHFSGGRWSGRVVAAGRDTSHHPPRALADAVAFVPQDSAASFVLGRVEDEIAYALENLGVDPPAMRRRVEEVLDLLDIAGLRDRDVRTLSGGERQRVAIAAALAAGPRLLVADEPTSQLDPQGAEDVLAALHRLVHDLGVTVVLAEHRLERVAGFADLAVGGRRARFTAGEVGEVLAWLGAGPPVTHLGRRLGWEPAPLTVREARRRAAGLDLPPPPGPPRPAPGEELVVARGLEAGYPGRPGVLRGIDLTVGAGELVALMGRNGSGKTTLLRCLAGLHAPAGGRVTFRGRPVRTGADVALCAQRPESVLFCETVRDEIEATRRGAFAELAPILGLQGLAGRHPRDLSAGQRLLVATGAVAATGAPVLLLDEPTRGLDPGTKAALVGFLRARCSAGGAAVVATHDVELAAEAATRVVLLASGEVIADGPPGQVLGDSPVFAPQMARVFGPGWLTVGQVAAAVGAAG